MSDNIDSFPPIPSYDVDRQMYYMTKEILSSYGYEQYEISNYAQKGYECKHNLKYWERCDYLGFGIGAASLYSGRRYTNISDIGRYMDVLAEITNALDKSYVNELLQIRTDMEELSKEDEMSEYMFLGLRWVYLLLVVDMPCCQ